MNVHIITIGDEILIGQIIDTNSAWMAGQLNLIGAHVSQINSIGDDEEQITDTVRRSLDRADVVLLTGGLGPTKDDITKNSLAELFQCKLEFHQPTYEKILKLFEKWGRETTPAHKAQCYLPNKASILNNKMGTAPGMWFEKNEKVLVSMPGVPYEMRYLMENEVIPKLQSRFPGQPIAHRTILTAGEGESRIAVRIQDFEESLPSHIKLAYLPNLGHVRLRLTAVGSDQAQIEVEIEQKAMELSNAISDLVYGHGEIKLEEAVGQLLRDKGLMLSTAESCTGGYVSHLITTIPGSSTYFKGGIVAYSNDVKMQQLNVNQETLESFGAVSEQTVTEMVRGSLHQLGSDLAIAISGIAGPGGGSPEKPVGTIWMAIGNHRIINTQKLQLSKNRLKNIQYTGNKALNMIREFVNQNYPL